jgi:hypothetical protein
MRFKARLGGRLTGSPHAESGYLYCKFLRGTPGLQSFWMHHPFVSCGAAGYEANYFVGDAQSLDAAGVRNLIKDRFCQGIESINVYSFGLLPSVDVPAPTEKGIHQVRFYRSPVQTSVSTASSSQPTLLSASL